MYAILSASTATNKADLWRYATDTADLGHTQSSCFNTLGKLLTKVMYRELTTITAELQVRESGFRRVLIAEKNTVNNNIITVRRVVREISERKET